jgi:hypothetical protein
MPNFDKWEKMVLQDLVLLVTGMFFILLTISGVLGLTGFMTFLVGCGLMGFAAFDISKIMGKAYIQTTIDKETLKASEPT